MRKLFIFYFLISLIYLLSSCSSSDTGYINLVTAPQQVNYSVFATHLIEIEVYPEQSDLSCHIFYHFGDKSDKIKKEMENVVRSKFKVELDPISYGETTFYSIRCELSSNEYIYYPSDSSEKYFSVVRDRSCNDTSDCLGGELCIYDFCELQPEFCLDDRYCPEGEICNISGDQKCYIPLNSCFSDSDCLLGEYCFKENCLPKGLSCDSDDSCFIGQSCVDGYCKNLLSCSGDSNCPDNMFCHLGMERCILKEECYEDSDCGDGEICNRYIGHCVEHLCQLHSDCYEGEICDSVTQICIRSNEIECYSDSDCDNSYCDIESLKCVSCLYHTQCGENQICIDNECMDI
ncbi:hypothetical protein JXR93_01225 [bacterium]|nr:hypothetical protein [bacterium]